MTKKNRWDRSLGFRLAESSRVRSRMKLSVPSGGGRRQPSGMFPR